MINVGGIWIPDSDDYLREKLTAIPNFADDYDAYIISRVLALPRRRVAVDVGANVGLWSRRLAVHFQTVHAFEPLEIARECLMKNIMWDNVHVYREALGDRAGMVSMRSKPTADGRNTTFKNHIAPRSGPGVPMRQLDSFPFTEVDFIKIDCEGFDYFVLVGAHDTINTWRPVIVFESKPKVSEQRYGIPTTLATHWLEKHGYDVEDLGRGNYFAQHKEGA